MDLVASCKDKLAYFRIKELKDVLNQLGLSKQGKKQDLVDRILATLSDERASGLFPKRNSVGKEDVAKLVDDIYRKMQVSGATGATGATDLASKSQVVSDTSNVKLKEEIEDTYHMKIRCVCTSSLQTETMIQCEDRRCHTWQHIRCVVIPDKPMEGGDPPIPPTTFYCEVCRLVRADPFWVTMGHPLYPAKLAITSVPADGTNPVQSIEKTFQITRADRDLLAKQEYDLQAWCMLLNDKVQFRMQWPQYADLQVNGVPVRAINRPGSQLLGANGRDDGPIITPCTRDGINKVTLTGCDARVFCLGVRLVKRRTVQQVLSMIPKVSDGEKFEDALARVRRCVGGGTATENADSDSDLEVVADCIPVNLRCPMSGSRIPSILSTSLPVTPILKLDHHSSDYSHLFPSLPFSNILFFKSAYNVQVVAGEHEPEEKLIGRFRRELFRAGVIQESKRRRFFESTQEKKKRKFRDAARRNRKRRPQPKALLGDTPETLKDEGYKSDEDKWDLIDVESPYT